MSENMWKSYIDERIGHLKKRNKAVELIMKSITGNVYGNMKEAIAISEIVTFATHMRTKIRLPDNTLVPVNGISFIIAESGASKDKSLNSARKCFAGIYNKMKNYLDKQAIKAAQKEAEDTGRPDDWQLYYKKAKPLFGGAKPTLSGVVAHLNSMQELSVGGGHVYSGEFGAELANGSSMIELLQFAAEIYDLGNMKADWRKTEEAQGKEIKSMNFSAVFITSPGHIIYDQSIKRKFVMEFTTKLARRSFFNFNQGGIPKIEETIEELLEREARELRESMLAVHEMEEMLLGIKPKMANILALADGIWEIYGVVKRYYEELSETVNPELESYRLSLAHTQWRALKLAGAFAQVDNRTEVTMQDFAEALHYCESTQTDIESFNIELNKESYELLDDYMNSIYKDEPVDINAHRLAKMGYIANVQGVKTKLRDLAEMANNISDGIYTADGTKITYEKLENRDVVGASYMQCKGDKNTRAKQCARGYEYKEVGFPKLASLLCKDTAFSTFEFKDGIRSNDNIIGGTKWVILDVDESDVTDEEAHDMLQEFNHHIARTSNKENPFKFRVILELDKYISVEGQKWKKFIESICKYVGITADLLSLSQVYFGYQGRTVLSTLDANTIEVKEHLLYANQEEVKKPKPNNKERIEMLNNSMDTFWYCYDFDSTKGTGQSLMLIRAAKHARDLGATVQQILNLMEDINEHWIVPLEEDRFERTIRQQIMRWSHKDN